MDLGTIEWGPVATWSAMAVTIVFSTRTWLSERSAKKSAKDAAQQAARSTEAAERSAEAQQQIAEVARRAFPEPKDFDFDIEYMQRGQFRIRNIGKRTASNIEFVQPEPIEGLPDALDPSPRWVNNTAVTLKVGEWADFQASAVSPAFGAWTTVYPKTVTITFDEGPTPLVLEMRQKR
ncbi:hypothetical protein OH799_25455 [Nocardia sp. NBC_00881]|uniref:hypothetical protein n=1 Tax=Nocardia sp. NBC_00881 TaxID=2975995 RepID=UPI003864632F|nr:hypothetical protein OH799_25455 [Nocardia sp. NBC_00881]